MLKSIPIANAITLANLTCGLLAISLALNTETSHYAFYLVILAAIFDFFDGMVARLLGQEGPLGQQLDSLADLVSFGVVPGLIWKSWMEIKGYCPPIGFCINSYIWLLIPLASAYRLARFNVESSGSTYFTGIPTPLTGITLASFALIGSSIEINAGFLGIESLPILSFPKMIFNHVYLWLYLPLVASFFMISDYPMLSLKFNSSDGVNTWRWLFIGGSILLIPLLGNAAFFGIYLWFILASFIAFRGRTNNTESL